MYEVTIAIELALKMAYSSMTVNRGPTLGGTSTFMNAFENFFGRREFHPLTAALK